MTNPKLEFLIKDPKQTAPAKGSERSFFSHEGLARAFPFLLLGGFIALLLILFGDRFIPAKQVDVESVVTIPQSGNESATAVSMPTDNPFDAPMLFQASGWIEPDPLPIKATALLSGVVDSVKVLEGETVTKGQVLATLIDDDAKLNLRSAQSRLASLKAQTEAHDGQIEISQAEIGTLQKKIAAADAKRAELIDVTNRFEELREGAASEREIEAARLTLLTHDAETNALKAEELELEGSLKRHHAMHKDFEAKVSEAEAEVALRQLDLDRTKIASPVDGIVLRLLAVPGQKRMLEMDDPDSATIAILYEPDRLQARIDVPLEEAAQLAVGQAVRIRSSFLSDKIFHGSVTRILGEADLQRNTLQAKVRIDEPDPRLRPEMLCRAEFLAAPAVPTDSIESATIPERIAVFVPGAALIETNSAPGQAEVWMLEPPNNRLKKQTLTLSPAIKDSFRQVRDGLKPGDRVVLNPADDLKAGQKVKPRPQ